jgi:hypothetical protein
MTRISRRRVEADLPRAFRPGRRPQPIGMTAQKGVSASSSRFVMGDPGLLCLTFLRREGGPVRFAS